MQQPDHLKRFAAAIGVYNASLDRHVEEARRNNQMELKEALERNRPLAISQFAEMFGVSDAEVGEGLALSQLSSHR